MTILNVTIEPSSSNWWKQRQRPTLEHWTELPKSSWRVGGVRIWAKRSRPWWGHPLKQLTWANGSSPTPSRKGRNQHRTKLDLLNVVTVVWLGQTVVPLAVAPGFVPAACTGFFEHILLGWIPYSAGYMWRALFLPRSNVFWPLEDGGENGRREGSLNWDIKWKKNSLVSF